MPSILSKDILFVIKRYTASFSGLPLIAWKGIFVSLIESLLIGVCYFLAIYFVEELHLSIFQSSLLIGCYGVGSIIGALLGGRLSDIISSRTVSVICLFLQSFVFFILKYNKDFYFLIPHLFTIGIGSYGFITSNHVWVLARCTHGEQQRLKAINILSVASNLGLGISALLISYFGLVNFDTIFSLSSILLFGLGIYFIFLNENKNKEIDINCTDNLSQKNQQIILSNKYIIYYSLVCLFLMGMIFSQFNSTFSLFLLNSFTDMGVKSFSIIFAINTLMVVILQTIIVDTFRKENKIMMLGLSTLTIGIGILILNFLYHFYFAILSIMILTIGEILFFSISQLICYENSPAEQKGRSMGLYRMVFASSRIIGPVIGGLIYQKLGGNILWYGCFLLGVLCLFPAFVLKVKD